MRSALAGQGYEVLEVRTGEDALEKLAREPLDLVLLDVNLPGMSGLEACRALRATSDVPVIMLTVRNSEQDKVQALDAGADDYITKPFSTPELLARIRAALRRAPMAQVFAGLPICLGDVEIDFQARRVLSGKRQVRLTPKELDLLWYLVTHPNHAIAHRELLQAVWGAEYGGEVEYLRVFVNRLRKKIEADPSNPKLLLTEPWVGYRLQIP
jgi:two-component system KDP operon response regulator KdpE